MPCKGEVQKDHHFSPVQPEKRRRPHLTNLTCFYGFFQRFKVDDFSPCVVNNYGTLLDNTSGSYVDQVFRFWAVSGMWNVTTSRSISSYHPLNSACPLRSPVAISFHIVKDDFHSRALR